METPFQKYNKMLARRSARIGLEVLHFFIWIALIVAVFTCQENEIPDLLVCLLAIPLMWHVCAGCPLTLLEDHICPSSGASGRSRPAMLVRRWTGLSLYGWDCMLASLTFMLLAVSFLRFLRA